MSSYEMPSLSYEMIQEILLRVDRPTLLDFCKHDTIGICDPRDNYFWRRKVFVDFRVRNKPEDLSWYEYWRYTKVSFPYSIMHEDPYVPEFFSSGEKIEDSNYIMSKQELEIVTERLTKRLHKEYPDGFITIDQNRKIVIAYLENPNMLNFDPEGFSVDSVNYENLQMLLSNSDEGEESDIIIREEDPQDFDYEEYKRYYDIEEDEPVSFSMRTYFFTMYVGLDY